MIPRLVPDGPKTGAWRLSGTISGIFSEIPNMMPDNWLYRRVGVGRYIVFALESSFRDIPEDLVSVSVSVFSISRNLAENSFPFSAFPGTSSKSRFCISCNFQFFSFFSCFFLCFFPCFSSFFPVFLVFRWKMMYLVSSRFPFTPISRLEFRLFPISRLEFCLVTYFSPISRLESPRFQKTGLAHPYRRVQMSCTLLYSQSSGIIFGISETIPEMVPDNRQAPFLGQSGTSFGIVRHQFWDCQAPVLGSHIFLGYKKEPKLWNEGCFRVFKGVSELPYVNICHISSHSNHVNHPFKVRTPESMSQFRPSTRLEAA